MTESQNPSMGILAAARRLQEAKIGAVARVVESRDNIARVEAELTEARKEDATAYAAALKAGWTEAELRQVGIPAPAKQASGRSRSARSRNRSRNASDDPAPNGRALLGLPPRGEAHVDGERQPEPAGAGA